MRPIAAVAEALGLGGDEWDAWGPGRAKVTADAARAPRTRDGEGRLVLVSAITPTTSHTVLSPADGQAPW